MHALFRLQITVDIFTFHTERNAFDAGFITGTVKGNSNASEIFADAARIEGEVASTGTVKIGLGSVIIGNVSSTSAVAASSQPRNTLPILMVHGTADHFVPCSMTEQGYAVCNGPKQLFLAQDAGHGVSMLIEPEKYEKLIIEFLDKSL